jgi:hypothetical protein
MPCGDIDLGSQRRKIGLHLIINIGHGYRCFPLMSAVSLALAVAVTANSDHEPPN